MAIIYINIFQFQALRNFTKIGIFGLKRNHLATLLSGEAEQLTAESQFQAVK
jgi:hypothetical protein